MAGITAALAAGLGATALLGRGVLTAEAEPLLLGVRLVVPALLALGGHLCARHADDRGPVLLVVVGLLLLESLVAGLRDLAWSAHLTWLAGLSLGQTVLGVVAGGVAATRRGRAPAHDTLLGGMPPARRPLVIAPIVLLALAALYPSVVGPEVGALQPLIAVLGGTAGLSTLAAAAGLVLVAPVAARATPSAGALALSAVAVLTLARLALYLGDVLAGRVAATVWLWLQLLAAVTLLGLSARVLSGPRDRSQ